MLQQLSAQGMSQPRVQVEPSSFVKLKGRGQSVGQLEQLKSGAWQRHRGGWWGDWRACVVPGVLGWESSGPRSSVRLHAQGTTPGLPASGCYRVKHYRYKRPTAISGPAGTRVQRLHDNLILTEMPHGLASRMRITPSGRAHSRLTVTKLETRPYEFGSWSHHIGGTWEWLWASHRPALTSTKPKPHKFKVNSQWLNCLREQKWTLFKANE